MPTKLQTPRFRALGNRTVALDMLLSERIEPADNQPDRKDPDCSALSGTPDPLTTPINRAHLARYTLGDQALEREILELFVERLPELIVQLQNASTEREWYMAAHSLKGSARAVGADQLGDLAALAEKQAAKRTQFDLQPLQDRAQGIIAYIAKAG